MLEAFIALVEVLPPQQLESLVICLESIETLGIELGVSTKLRQTVETRQSNIRVFSLESLMVDSHQQEPELRHYWVQSHWVNFDNYPSFRWIAGLPNLGALACYEVIEEDFEQLSTSLHTFRRTTFDIRDNSTDPELAEPPFYRLPVRCSSHLETRRL